MAAKLFLQMMWKSGIWQPKQKRAAGERTGAVEGVALLFSPPSSVIREPVGLVMIRTTGMQTTKAVKQEKPFKSKCRTDFNQAREKTMKGGTSVTSNSVKHTIKLQTETLCAFPIMPHQILCNVRFLC